MCAKTKNCRSHCERQLFLIFRFVDMDDTAWWQLSIDDEFGYTVFDIVLDGSLQRSSAKLYVVAFLCHKFLGILAEVDGVSHIADALIESFEFHVDNLLDGFEIQLVEGDNLVESVQEFWRELLRECFLHYLSCVFLILFVEHQCT